MLTELLLPSFPVQNGICVSTTRSDKNGNLAGLTCQANEKDRLAVQLVSALESRESKIQTMDAYHASPIVVRV